MTTDDIRGLQAQLDDMRTMILRIHEKLDSPKETRTRFTVEEAAKLLGKRPYTVREWCRHGRLNASKRPEKRGGAELWSISAEEVARYKNEGLLEADAHRNAA